MGHVYPINAMFIRVLAIWLATMIVQFQQVLYKIANST